MANTRITSKPVSCLCGSGKPYASCCSVFHSGTPAPTPEALMRSRYVAFCMRIERYLFDTWHTRTRPQTIRLTAEEPPPAWLGLSVKRTASEGDTGIVEFVARYRIGGGSAVRMHETSRFVREGGRWFYVDGDRHDK